jgi:hypothetical protein
MTGAAHYCRPAGRRSVLRDTPRRSDSCRLVRLGVTIRAA